MKQADDVSGLDKMIMIVRLFDGWNAMIEIEFMVYRNNSCTHLM